MFPFSVVMKPILKSLVFIDSNLNFYRHSVSIVLIVEPLSVLSVRNENKSLQVVLHSFYCCFQIFYEIYKEFLVCFMVKIGNK